MNMALRNPTERWASAPFLVPKPGPSKFRFSVDLRLVNRYTKPQNFPMLKLNTELMKLSGSKVFEYVYL